VRAGGPIGPVVPCRSLDGITYRERLWPTPAGPPYVRRSSVHRSPPTWSTGEVTGAVWRGRARGPCRYLTFLVGVQAVEVELEDPVRLPCRYLRVPRGCAGASAWRRCGVHLQSL